MISSSEKDKPRFYEWLAVPIFVMVALCSLFTPISLHHEMTDYYHHLAVVHELMARPFSPGSPHVLSDEPSRYFSPHLWVLCLLGKLFLLSPETVLGLAGTAAIGLYLWGIYGIGKRLHPSPFAPLLLLAFCSFAWGFPFITFVSFHNLSSLVHNATYPSTFSLGLALLGYVLFLKVLEQNRLPLWKIPFLALFIATLALSHPLTGLFGLGLTGCVIAFGPASSFLLRVKLLAIWACGVGLATLWPLYSYVDLFLLSADDPDWEADWFKDAPFWLIFSILGPACVGFLAIPRYLRSREYRPLALSLIVLLSGFFYGWSIENSIAHRLIPFVAIFLHMGMTTMAFRLYPAYAELGKESKHIIKYGTLTVAMLLVMIQAMMVSLKFSLTYLNPYALYANEDLPVNYLNLAKCIKASIGKDDAVVMAFGRSVFPIQGTGTKAASMPLPLTFVHDLKDRQADEAVFFGLDTTREERLEIARKYGAAFAVYGRDLAPEIAEKIDALGPKEIFYRHMFMVRLDAEKERRPKTTFWSEDCKTIPLDAHRDENLEWK